MWKGISLWCWIKFHSLLNPYMRKLPAPIYSKMVLVKVSNNPHLGRSNENSLVPLLFYVVCHTRVPASIFLPSLTAHSHYPLLVPHRLLTSNIILLQNVFLSSSLLLVSSSSLMTLSFVSSAQISLLEATDLGTQWITGYIHLDVA